MRLVIKVGSNVLTRNDGKLDITRMSALVDQIAWLRENGYEVILVSSGAMASGRGELKIVSLTVWGRDSCFLPLDRLSS